MLSESALRAELEEEQQRSQQILEQERSRILAEHISKLQGYIPKGVLSQVLGDSTARPDRCAWPRQGVDTVLKFLTVDILKDP